jgi:sec-independent protein translocase protein TatA
MYTGVLLEFLNMGGSEIMLILAVVMLLFGGKKLPELARGLGKGIRDFKDASEGVKREIHRNINAVDIEEELAADRNTVTAKPAEQTLEEQMYPKTEVKEPISLIKEVSPVHQEVIPVPSETPVPGSSAPEIEKNKI